MRISYQPKILEILGATKKLNGTKTFGKKFPKIWVHPREVVLLLKILENAVPLIRSEYWKLPKIQTGLFA